LQQDKKSWKFLPTVYWGSVVAMAAPSAGVPVPASHGMRNRRSGHVFGVLAAGPKEKSLQKQICKLSTYDWCPGEDSNLHASQR
jgi:hypothetical protein